MAPGIPEQDMKKLFDPFFSTKFTGRGLGLSVALGMVKAHGGCITVKTRVRTRPLTPRGLRPGGNGEENQAFAVRSAPGDLREESAGSVFRVFLPLSEEALPRPAEEGAKVSPQLKGGGKALLIEDDPQVRQLAERVLELLGFDALTAKDGVEGVEIFRERRKEIRFVLCDLTMPRMDGWATIAALREIDPNVRIILASGYDEASVMSGDHAEQPQVFFGKPYSIENLRKAISKIA